MTLLLKAAVNFIFFFTFFCTLGPSPGLNGMFNGESSYKSNLELISDTNAWCKRREDNETISLCDPKTRSVSFSVYYRQ